MRIATTIVARRVAALTLIPTSFAAGQATFEPIGDLPGGQVWSWASAVSNDGSVVVGYSEGTAGCEAVRWTISGGIVGLGDLVGGDFHSTATDVSGDGAVVVGYSNGVAGIEAFRWTDVGGMVGLGQMQGSTNTFASGVSADGSVVVGHDGLQAFRQVTAGGFLSSIVPATLPGGTDDTRANAVSANGRMVVGVSNGLLGDEAFIWTVDMESSPGPRLINLGDLAGGAHLSEATAVSDDGAHVVGYSEGDMGHEPFIWTLAEGMTGLGSLTGGDCRDCRANAVAADGSVVVGTSGLAAFIWDEEQGMRDLKTVLTDDYGLDLAGWFLVDATGISSDGRTIVGAGVNPKGAPEGWVVTLPSSCPPDLNGDGVVDSADLLLLIGAWGSCP